MAPYILTLAVISIEVIMVAAVMLTGENNPTLARDTMFSVLMIVLNGMLGYEKSASIAKEALKTGGSVYELVLEKGWLKKEELDDMLRPENMTDPREIPK